MTDAAVLYETDYHDWLQAQAAALRRAGALGSNLDLDFETLAEEIESMGNSQLIALESALARVVDHLLKLEFSPANEPRNGWRQSVSVHRFHAARQVRKSPSLLRKIDLDEIYADARKLAAVGLRQDGMTARDLPESCPYTLDQVRDDDWWPASRHGLD
jgi:hypothetical protein